MRAALYIRVSTQEQAKSGFSLGDQKTSLLEYAKEHGHTVVGIYEDAGISARKSYKKRPAMVQLLKDCEAKLFDVVLFIKLDRWFRSVPDYYEVQPILERNGVFWQATKEDYETVTASGRFKVNIMLSVAQDEADRTSERIKFVNEGKRARQQALTGQVPYGYKIVNSKIVKDPNLEPIVNTIFSTYKSTGSFKRTQDTISDTFGTWLNYWVIDKVLRSDAYVGTYYDTPGMCPAYITQEQHQHFLEMRKRVVRKAPSNRIYPFSGLITCGECGGRMAAKCSTQHNCFVCYACSRRSTHKTNCANHVTLSQAKIEAYLVDTLDEKLKQYKLHYENAKPVNNSGQIHIAKTKLNRLKELYLNELITLDEFRTDKEKYEEQIQQLESQAQRIPDFSAIDSLLVGDWKTLYYDSSPEAKAKFWRILIREIIIYKDRHIEYSLNI